MSQIIGKVGMTPRGMYDRTRAYERLDVVTYQGSSWVAIVDVPAQISPAMGSDYWQLQARMGETGPQGPVGPQGNSAFDGTGVELVNNLTQGGQTAALSAEQGKILKQELTELESEVGDRIEVYEDAIRLDEGDLYICDKKGNIVARIGANGIVAAGFGSSDMETIKNGKDDFKITDSQGNVILKLSANSSIDDIIRTYLEKRYIKPALSWIDDDFQIFVGDHGEGGEVVMPFYQGIHDWMIEKDIRMDFAYIPSSSEARMKLLHEWEDENFRFLLHPDHDGWYAQYGNVHDITKVRKGIVNCIRHFRQNNIMTDCKILVWPGSSDQFPDNVNAVKNYIDCGITAMGTSSNEGLKESRLKLQRLALSLSPTKTKTWMKNYIKECLERGDWVILYTHLYNESYVPTDVVDETTNSLANIKEIVEYANSICPMRSTEEIWNERKFIYDYVKL